MAAKQHSTPRHRKPAVPTPTPRKTAPTKPATSKRGKDVLNSARELAQQDQRRRKAMSK